MTTRRFAALAFAALTLGALFTPADASAQSIWDVIRDRAGQNRNRDYERDRRGRDDDYYGRRRGGYISDYERRALRDVSRRISNNSRSFQRNLDRALDDSRYDDTRREDNLNDIARRLRDAADRFKDRAGDSNDLSRSSNEARQLLDAASQVSRRLRRVRLDGRAASDWSQLRNDLRTVANIYGLRFNDDNYGGYYGNDDDYRRDRRSGGAYGNRWPY
jgi:hypothetical protein